MRVIAASPSAEVETDQNTISGTCDYLGSTPMVDLPVDSQGKQNEKTTTTATPQWVALARHDAAKYEPCYFIYFYPVVIHLIYNSLLGLGLLCAAFRPMLCFMFKKLLPNVALRLSNFYDRELLLLLLLLRNVHVAGVLALAFFFFPLPLVSDVCFSEWEALKLTERIVRSNRRRVWTLINLARVVCMSLILASTELRGGAMQWLQSQGVCGTVASWRCGPFAELLWTLVFNYTYAFACAYGENIFDR